MLNRSVAIVLWLVMTIPCVGFLHADEGETKERSVVDFRLKDYRGKEHALADFRDNQFVVGIFLGTECPLAKLYGSRVAELSKQFGPRGVAFVGFISNQQDSITEISSYARRHAIEFPVLKDLKNEFADQIGAERTPEVFVWDQSGRIHYRGRIDDQYGVGYARSKPTRHDLTIALDQLLADKQVTTPVTKAVGCLIGRVRQPDPNSRITYSNQIARIMQKRCVECHRAGEIAPFELRNYDEVVGWSEMIAEVVKESRMPPWHADPAHGEFLNDRRLSDEEKEQIFAWVSAGAPEGNPADLPPPRKFIDGSQLPQAADIEFTMREKPFVVKAEGEVAYQNFIVDPGFKEDKWITMAEALPGNRSVVHHIVVYIVPPTSKAKRGFAPGTQFLTTYVPGYQSRPLPEGMAKWMPAGSKLIFQLHYTPIGTEQTDLSKLRLVFTNLSEVNRVVVSSAVQIRHQDFLIPANAQNHRSEASQKIRFKDAKLISLFPHMHLRGRSFRMEVKYPDGQRETLLNVPNYDFNWQTTYRLRAPKSIPEGAELIIVGHHNNSSTNLANPDPSESVRWGDQTWEEMLIGLYEWSIPMPEHLANK